MRDKIIIKSILDNKDDFVLGKGLSKNLGVSRDETKKNIKALKEEWDDIQTINKKGYELIKDQNNLIIYQNTCYDLETNIMGKKIFYFKSIDSTNDFAKKIALRELEGTVIISEEQTKGKGKIGRCWHSKYKEGIWMSIILKPDIIPQNAPFITLIAGASIFKALKKLGVKTTIKWPNDIIINHKKIAGILTELSAETDKINYIVLGIGINVKTIEFSQEISEIATSLYKEGYKISRVDIIRNILREFENLYLQYINEGLKKDTLYICRRYSSIIGKDIYLTKDEDKELVRCLGMNEDGNLIVRTEDNIIKEIISGDVSIRGVKEYV